MNTDDDELTSSDGEDLRIKPAIEEDLPTLLRLIRDLAEYERLTDEVSATVEDLRTALFQDRVAEAIIATRSHRAVGFAIFFQNFSTFLGRAGLYLEDLYVRPEHRGCGIGKALFEYVNRLAHERNCGRFEWAVLDWNKPAWQFYESRGARPMADWTVFRMDRAAIKVLAQRSVTSAPPVS